MSKTGECKKFRFNDIKDHQKFISIFFIAWHLSAGRLEGEGILGGETAKNGQFPYQVSLQIFGKHVCGGAIIDERHIVAAAHCVYTVKNKFVTVPIKIVAGVSSLANSENRVMINVARVFIPKEYDPHVRPYYSTLGDISILEVYKIFYIL